MANMVDPTPADKDLEDYQAKLFTLMAEQAMKKQEDEKKAKQAQAEADKPPVDRMDPPVKRDRADESRPQPGPGILLRLAHALKLK